MKVLFLGGFAASQFEWIAPVIESDVETSVVADEGERERPYEKYPWDGVSGVRPFRQLAATTTVGVY